MKYILVLLLLTGNIYCATAQTSVYYDPNFPKPTSGYGADGTHTVGVDSFPNPYFPSKDIWVYYPSDVSTPVPTIFYNHAFGGNDPDNVDGMLYFVAKKGYAIVFVPYQTVGVTIPYRYDNLLNGFLKAARTYTSIIDTTRVGFLGWSFGGGAVFANAYQCFTTYNWGSNGRFIYALAQWYSYNISEAQLLSFPTDVKLLTEIFDDDETNDHRMAIDIFKTIDIPDSEKDFLMVRSDTIGGYEYIADHSLPNSSSAFNALDYYGYYRLLDALCDYTFNGNLAGKQVALGHGSAAQVTMPTGLKNLVETSSPIAQYSQSKYEYPCDDTQNLRSAYCPAGAEVNSVNTEDKQLHLYPNPAANVLYVQMPVDLSHAQLVIQDIYGKVVYSSSIHSSTNITIDIANLCKGMYFLTVGDRQQKFVKE